MPYTFADLKAEVRSILWPAGLDEQENLIVAHNKMFVEALVEIQRWVPCLQYNNTQLFRACSRFYVCGLNMMEQPASQNPLRSIANTIRRVSVIDRIDPVTKRESASAPDEWCSSIVYERKSWVQIQAYQQQVQSCSSCGGFANFSGLFGYPAGDCEKGNYPTPDDAEYLASPGLPMGHHYQPQASTNSKLRARRGVWALNHGRIYIAPWLQSTETVVVEWDGIKNLWDNLDLVDDSAQLKRAVRYYVAWNQAKDYDRDPMAAQLAERDYREALAWLARDCREEMADRTISNLNGGMGSPSRMADIPLESQGGPRGQTKPKKSKIQPPDDGHGDPPGCSPVAAPTIYPPFHAIVTFPIKVVLTAVTPGSVIHYTTNGSIPTLASPTYTNPFNLASGLDVHAIAFLGNCPSDVTMSLYRNASDPDVVDPDGMAPILTTLCSRTDRAGQWGVFVPGQGPDINWKLEFKFKAGAVIKRLEMFETDSNGNWTTGRCWATKQFIKNGFNSYPVVIDNAAGQIKTDYTDNLDQSGRPQQSWFMFGNETGVPASGAYYRLEIYMVDGDVFYGHSGITCLPPPDPISFNCVSGNCVSVFGNSGAYGTLEACLAAGCTPSFNCQSGVCVNPGDGTGTYPTMAACLTACCNVSVTATDLIYTDDGNPNCLCHTVNLASQVTVTNGVLIGFTDSNGGSFGPSDSPCLANPGLYTFTAYAQNANGTCFDQVEFTVALECVLCAPCANFGNVLVKAFYAGANDPFYDVVCVHDGATSWNGTNVASGQNAIITGTGCVNGITNEWGLTTSNAGQNTAGGTRLGKCPNGTYPNEASGLPDYYFVVTYI